MKKNDRYKIEDRAFQKVISGNNLNLFEFCFLLSKVPFSIIEGLLRNISGPLGFKLRYYFYKPFMRHLGKGVLIDTGVKLSGIRNISISDYSWVESYSIITAYLDEIEIGKRVHIAPFSVIHANKKIQIGDYVGISFAAKIISSTSVPNNKRMSGPTVPKEMMSIESGPIKIGKDAVIYANSLIMPNTVIGEGAVISANSIIYGEVQPYDIVLGYKKVIGKREKVTEKDI